MARGHALSQNLRTGFAAVPVAVPRVLRLATVWPQRAQAIERVLRTVALPGWPH